MLCSGGGGVCACACVLLYVCIQVCAFGFLRVCARVDGGAGGLVCSGREIEFQSSVYALVDTFIRAPHSEKHALVRALAGMCCFLYCCKDHPAMPALLRVFLGVALFVPWSRPTLFDATKQ